MADRWEGKMRVYLIWSAGCKCGNAMQCCWKCLYFKQGRATCERFRQHKLELHPQLRHINDVVTPPDYWFLIMVAGLPIKSRIVLMSPLLQWRSVLVFSRLGKPSASVRRVVANDEFYEGYKSWRIITLLGQLAALHYTLHNTKSHYSTLL